MRMESSAGAAGGGVGRKASTVAAPVAAGQGAP